MSASTIVARRRDRCIASILSFKEDEIDQSIDPHIAAQFRKLILDSINDVCSLAIDLLDESVLLNEIVVDKIDELIDSRMFYDELEDD